MSADLKNIILEKIKEVSFKKVNEDSELLKSGILTSILVVDLANALEEELNISIPFNEITAENFENPLAIEKLLLTKTQ
jgi:acyl carrier protein